MMSDRGWTNPWSKGRPRRGRSEEHFDERAALSRWAGELSLAGSLALLKTYPNTKKEFLYEPTSAR